MPWLWPQTVIACAKNLNVRWTVGKPCLFLVLSFKKNSQWISQPNQKSKIMQRGARARHSGINEYKPSCWQYSKIQSKMTSLYRWNLQQNRPTNYNTSCSQWYTLDSRIVKVTTPQAINCNPPPLQPHHPPALELASFLNLLPITHCLNTQNTRPKSERPRKDGHVRRRSARVKALLALRHTRFVETQRIAPYLRQETNKQKKNKGKEGGEGEKMKRSTPPESIHPGARKSEGGSWPDPQPPYWQAA